MKRNTLTATLAVATMLASGCSGSMGGTATTATPEKIQKVEEAPNGTFITVNGTVVNPGRSAFELDYGPGLITVEMDDMDWDADGAALFEDDRVTVTGRIDDDFYETRTIEAGSVYVKGLDTHFYASSLDEEDYLPLATGYAITDPAIHLTGTVQDVGDEHFVLDTGALRVDVDTGLLPYDPLDDEGYQQIDPGDRVRVYGDLKPTLFADHNVEATMVISLAPAS